MMARLRLVLAGAGFVLVTIILLPLQLLFVKTGWALQKRLPVLFHKIVRRLLGIRIHVHGEMARGRPLMLAANHSSWADIIVLSAVGEVSFIAKSQVATWPLFGLFAKLQRSVFVEREKRGKTHDQASEIATRLASGDVMVLFAEGTTSDGNRILPFKTSLFGAAQVAIRETSVETVTIQPVAIAYTKVHGVPMGRFHRPIIAWPGDVELGPSLIGMLKEGAYDVDVRFGEPDVIDGKSDRKALARTMEERVRTMMQVSLQGRDYIDPETAPATNLHDPAIFKEAKKL
ncbi:1-acyl-sn-glycerol-3-phosphate acyltransferase [Phyllobacterium sp. SB3]|uniref:lysophospholipid acyltransferase family protein n=1 Tax=Phyllobacterium sp. SB3 TaxID=3156073 RepID=UPI0032AEBBDA